MTCYLTSRDDRFAAAVAGGVVSDVASMAGTGDLGHLLGTLELGATPWEARDRYEAMSPLARVEHVSTPTLVYHGAADLRCPVGQAQQWYAALRGRGVPTRLVLYPEASHLFVLDGRPSHRIDFNRRIMDWIEQHAAGDRPSLDADHWQARLGELADAAQGSRRDAGHPPPPRRRRGRGGRGGPRAPEQGDGRRHDLRLGLPDRLDDEGLDGDRGDAAGGRGEAGPRRAARRRPPRAAARRCGRDAAGDDAAPALAHERDRRRHLHRHRSRRRLPREVRGRAERGGAEPPARRDLVLLQLGLLARRPRDREAHGRHLGRRDPRTAHRAARPEPHRDAAGGGAAAPRRRRPPHDRGRAGAGAHRVGPSALGRAGRADQLDGRGRARVRADAPDRGRRRRTARGS